MHQREFLNKNIFLVQIPCLAFTTANSYLYSIILQTSENLRKLTDRDTGRQYFRSISEIAATISRNMCSGHVIRAICERGKREKKKKGVSLIAFDVRGRSSLHRLRKPLVFSTVITEKCGKGPAKEPYVDVGWGSMCMCHQEIRRREGPFNTEAYYSTIVQSAQ